MKNKSEIRKAKELFGEELAVHQVVCTCGYKQYIDAKEAKKGIVKKFI